MNSASEVVSLGGGMCHVVVRVCGSLTGWCYRKVSIPSQCCP